MSAIRGYFKGLDNKQYIVKIFQQHESDTFTEVELAGETPFVVTYNTSNTPFEPSRTSTATISVVHNTYLDELISPYAQGTKVKLIHLNEETNVQTCVWTGYLVPKVYNQAYSNCYETIELEAADCVSVLQYLDYELLNDGGCVTFKQIIDNIMERVPLISDFYWPHSKQSNGNFLTPSDLGIFEKNFFTNDTDEPWKLNEVMDEMCKYLGLTLIQWQDDYYFVDYTAIGQGDDRYYRYNGDTQYGDAYISNYHTMSQELSRGNDADISFEPIYNKVVVKDNFYNVEEMIPNLFDDEYLTNRNGDFFYSTKITPATPLKAEYVDKIRKSRDDKWASEETSDDKYSYYMRMYDNKFYTSLYEETDNMQSQITEPYDMVGRLGATIVDLAVVDDSTFYGEVYDPTGSGNGVQIGTTDYANSLDFKRYLCICENHSENTIWGANSNTHRVVMRSKTMKIPCQITKDSYMIFNYNATLSRYKDRPYLNPDWTNKGASGPDKYQEGTGHWGITQWPQGPVFRVVFGDKCWSRHDYSWVSIGDKWDTCGGSLLKDSPAKDFWNEELSIANKVTYSMNINESGEPIPLSEVNKEDEFYIEFLCPQPSFWAYKNLDMWDGYEFESHNGWTWISDFSIKLCEKGQDIEKLDSDVVYENVIDVDSINEFGEIDFKFTTWHPNIKPSYSNVVTWVNGERVHLTSIKESNLSNSEQTPEENMIERYVLQYQTPTKKITHSLPIDGITPFDRIGGLDISNEATAFMALGAELDYANGIQRITYIQTK